MPTGLWACTLSTVSVIFVSRLTFWFILHDAIFVYGIGTETAGMPSEEDQGMKTMIQELSTYLRIS